VLNSPPAPIATRSLCDQTVHLAFMGDSRVRQLYYAYVDVFLRNKTVLPYGKQVGQVAKFWVIFQFFRECFIPIYWARRAADGQWTSTGLLIQRTWPKQ